MAVGGGEGRVVEAVERPGEHVARTVGVHAVGGVEALRGEEVVDRFVRAVGGGEEVVALVEDIRLGVGIVVAGEVFGRNGDLHFYRLVRADFCLFGVEEHDGGLFNEVVPVIFGVRLLYIQLREEVAVFIGVVGDGDGGGDVAVFAQVDGDVRHFLRVIEIRDAVAEGVDDLFVVIPGGAVGGACRGRSVERRVGDAVVIAGLIILVADVDAFRLDDVIAAAVRRAAETGGAGSAGIDRFVRPTGIFAHFCVYFADVHIFIAAEVHHRGSGHVFISVCIGQGAGGVVFAGEHLHDADALIVVDDAHVADGVYFVRAAFGDVADLHGVAGVEEDDDRIAGVLGGVYHGELVFGEGQRVFIRRFACEVRGACARFIGVRFACAAGKHDDTDAVFLGLRHLLAPVGRDVDPGACICRAERCIRIPVGRYLAHLIVCQVAGAGDVTVVVGDGGVAETAALRVVGEDVVVNILHLLVEREACVDERLVKVLPVGVARLQVARRLHVRLPGRRAEQGNALRLIEGQRVVVVLHHDEALAALFDGKVLCSFHHLGRRIVMALEPAAALCVDDVALRSKETIYRRSPLGGDVEKHDTRYQKRQEDDRQAAPKR